MVHFPEFVKPLHLGSTLGHKGHLAFFFVKNAKTRFAIFREGNHLEARNSCRSIWPLSFRRRRRRAAVLLHLEIESRIEVTNLWRVTVLSILSIQMMRLSLIGLVIVACLNPKRCSAISPAQSCTCFTRAFYRIRKTASRLYFATG